MDGKRYIEKVVPITEDEARIIRAEMMDGVRAVVQDLKRQLKEAEDRYWEIKHSPWPVTQKILIELNPGDAGYADAPETIPSWA